MTIASMYSVPQSEADFMTFSFANQDHHRLVVTSLNKQGYDLTTYQLDPVPTFDLATWLQRHQQAHNDLNSALGTTGTDLTDLDIKNKQQLSAWIFLHVQEHIQWQNKTGIA